MNTDFRNRVVLPIVLPLAVLLGIAIFVGGLALVLLYNPRVTSLTIALVGAAGLMVAFSLASSIDEEHMTIGRRGAILAAGVLPLVLGAAAALYAVNGGVPEEELMINRLPALTVPEGAIIGAQNSQSFCIPADEEGSSCEDTQEITIAAQPDSPTFVFEFLNLEGGVTHNVQLFELAEEDGAPAPGPVVFGVAEGAATIVGVDEIVYQVNAETPFEAGNEFYYNCVVHPAMNGVLTIGEPAE